MKKRITLDEDEIIILAHIMNHFTDYMAGDDRPDHGLGILSGYREMDIERKRPVFCLAGKLMRYSRKIRKQLVKEWMEKYEKENEG